MLSLPTKSCARNLACRIAPCNRISARHRRQRALPHRTLPNPPLIGDPWHGESKFVTVQIVLRKLSCVESCDMYVMTVQWIFWSAILVMGIAVAAGAGYFLFQGEGLSALVFSFPPAVAIAGSLWLTRNFFAKEPS
jgi:hypothetical protein